jgi:hypothetical protein
MTNVVSTAITNGTINYQTSPQTKWLVTFTNNESRKGTLLDLGGGTFLLEGSNPYYFSADQVVYLTPSHP